MSWIPGRQGGGYFKKKLFESTLLKMDAWLLRFPEGAEIKDHNDPAPGYEHNRINVILKRPKKGGDFYIIHMDIEWPWTNRLVRFRPDITFHGMTKVEEGEGLWLSIGWLRKA